MTDPTTPVPRSGPYRALLYGALWGSVYGICLRLLADGIENAGIFWVMSLAFLVVGPTAIGFLAVHTHPRPSLSYRLFAPWVPLALGTAFAVAIGLEGSICVIMGAPIMLLAGSIGGYWAGNNAVARATPLAAVLLLPLISGAVESRIGARDRLHRVRTTIDIAAPPEVIWREIASVREIEEAELPPALYLSMGFPRPLSAEIDRPGVGGVRQARFEGGVLFLETVTDWVDGKRLGFRIVAQTDSILPTTLDPHVIVGGPYFDVFHGQYVIDSVGPGHSRLHLSSELRVSTHFNWYAGWWADAVMRSIQETILAVQKARAERAAAAT